MGWETTYPGLKEYPFDTLVKFLRMKGGDAPGVAPGFRQREVSARTSSNLGLHHVRLRNIKSKKSKTHGRKPGKAAKKQKAKNQASTARLFALSSFFVRSWKPQRDRPSLPRWQRDCGQRGAGADGDPGFPQPEIA
jgi:hypothetical protein